MAIPLIIDGLVVLVLLVSAGISLLRGLVREVLTILGVAGGVAAAWLAGGMAVPIVEGWMGIEDPEKAGKFLGVLPYDVLAMALAYGGIFTVVVIVLSVVSHILAKFVHASGLGILDRTLGVVFGLARGVLLLAVLYLPFHLLATKDTKQEWFAPAQSYPYLEAVSSWLAGYLPGEPKPEKDGGENESARDSLKRLLPEDMPEDMDIENLMNTAREKLKALDPGGRETKSQDMKDGGYKEGQREGMERLIEREVLDGGNE